MTSNFTTAKQGMTRHSRSSAMRRTAAKTHPYAVAGIAIVGALAGSALINRHLAKRAEQNNPPVGKFLDVDGIRLHYVELGEGEPLVLLHGNGTSMQDFVSSGLVNMAAKKYRVIAFDRPGFGHSERPRTTIWTPEAQADVIHRALARLHVSQATVVGHSWGASVAIALALKYPQTVGSLVLASGYYYPTARTDVAVLSGPAVPVVGDIIRYTLSPIIGRMIWPALLRKMFGPKPVPRKFDGFPKEMALRPSQIRASAAEAALMIPNALASSRHYPKLRMPVVIVAGEKDRLVDIDKQSARLHRDVTQSTFYRVPRAGHMVHQTNTDTVMAAIDEATAKRRQRRRAETGSRAA
jgi:pimeloyl-ACP methyl ester carboxylesterase